MRAKSNTRSTRVPRDDTRRKIEEALKDGTMTLVRVRKRKPVFVKNYPIIGSTVPPEDIARAVREVAAERIVYRETPTTITFAVPRTREERSLDRPEAQARRKRAVPAAVSARPGAARRVKPDS